MSKKQNISYDIMSLDIFEIQGIGWHLTLMRISYKLSKRPTKTEFEKFCNLFKIINFMTIRYKSTTSGKPFIQYSNKSLQDRSAFYVYMKNKKQAKKRKFKKIGKSIERIPIKKIFSKFFLISNIF